MSSCYRIIVVFLVACGMHVTSRAESLTFDDFTEADWRLLPEWCKYTQSAPGVKKESNRYREYMRVYGEDFMHMHHYCLGVVEFMRSETIRIDPRLRGSYEYSSSNNFKYVLRNSEPGFVLRLDCFRKLVLLHQRRGEHKEAIKWAMAGVAEFPKEAESHIALAGALVGAGQSADAAAILDRAMDKVSNPARISEARSILLPRK